MTELIRRQGQLFEQPADLSLKDRVNQLGTTTPTSPAAASSIGANPDQAKMAGTPNQKKPVLEQQVKKEDTLAGAKRLEGPREAATPQEASAQQRASQLRQIGSLGTRVQSLIEQRLQQAAQTQVGQALVNQDVLAQTLGLTPQQAQAQAAIPTSKYALAQQALQQYAASPNGLAAEQALVTLTNLGIPPQSARDMLQTGAKATGQTVAQATADTLTLGDVDVTQLGYQDLGQLAAVLGTTPEEAATLTVPQLQQRVQDLQAAELQKVQQLRAQLAATPPGSAQHQILQQQLADMGQVGVTGTEAGVQEAVESLNLADQVQVGGEEYSVEDILKDENLSALIEEYVSAGPDRREELLPAEKFGVLRQWIDENELALADLASEMGETATAFTSTQEAWKKLGQLSDKVNFSDDILKEIIPGWTPDKAVTSEDLALAKGDFQSSPLGTLATSEEYKGVAPEVLSKITAENVKNLKDLPPATIIEAHEAAKFAADPAVKELLGLEGTPAFVTDPAMREKLDAYKPVVEKLRKAGVLETWVRDPNVRALTPAQLSAMADDPAVYEEFKAYHDAREKIENAKSVEDVFSLLLGHSVTPTQLKSYQREYDDLKAMARVGAPGAKDKLDKFVALLDANRDGKLDNNDLTPLLQRLREDVGPGAQDAVIGGKGLKDIFTEMRDVESADFDTPTEIPDRAFYEKIRELTADHRFDVSDLAQLPEDWRGKAWDLARKQDWGSLPQGSYSQHVDNQAWKATREEVAGMLPKNFEGFANKLKWFATRPAKDWGNKPIPYSSEDIMKIREALSYLTTKEKQTPRDKGRAGVSRVIQSLKDSLEYINKIADLKRKKEAADSLDGPHFVLPTRLG